MEEMRCISFLVAAFAGRAVRLEAFPQVETREGFSLLGGNDESEKICSG